jgi:hypothetical protein
VSLLAYQYVEKYAKKLIGRTDIEDALKRLDKLTHEEAWMGIAQNLKATHALGESMNVVVDKVAIIDNRVPGVDDRMRVVDNNVAEVIRGG